MSERIIHILMYGKPLCRFSDKAPREWPLHHYWVSFADPVLVKKANCEQCKKRRELVK